MPDNEVTPAEKLEWSTEELTDDEWMQFIACAWRDALSDPETTFALLKTGKPCRTAPDDACECKADRPQVRAVSALRPGTPSIRSLPDPLNRRVIA